MIVHGAWGGSHHWKDVAGTLQEQGYQVHRVTLTGLGLRSHLLSPSVNLSTHVQDVVNYLDFEDLNEVILIGHSYGGAVTSGAIDRSPKRIAAAVFLDAHMLDDGESCITHQPEKGERFQKLAQASGEGWYLPVTWKNSVRDTPHPLACLTEELVIKNEIATDIDVHYWLFAEGKDPSADSCYVYLQRAKSRGYATRVFDWDHNPHRSRPNDVVEALVNTVLSTLPKPRPKTASLDFNRDVRPILSDKCYFCHGPDADHRQADLRLDIREEAEYVLDSELLERVHSQDADTVMPPPESKLELTTAEKKILEQWIHEGAEYAAHWAFEPLPESVGVPVPNDTDWAKNEIDHFVRSKQEENHLTPSNEAPPLRWLRRVTLDLTGLPPKKAEIESFRDQVAIAENPRQLEQLYERTVDRLLDTVAYAEHMAVSWLDVARYADSYGYQSDKLNTQWPYRDWVIRAFDQNLPYDQFLTWQIAGDLLEKPTRDQQLATAFNRIHRLNNEGGAVFEEWRVENVADRVHTFGTAVLGLTLECSRCHDHKYDPISMRDYYSLSAFFNSIDESGVYDRTQKVPCPSLLLPTTQQQAVLEKSAQQVAAAERKLRKELSEAKTRHEAWLKRSPSAEDAAQTSTIPDLFFALSFDAPFQNELKEIYHPSQSDRGWTQPLSLVKVEDCEIIRLLPDEAADDSLLAKLASEKDAPTSAEPSTTANPLPSARVPVSRDRMAVELDGEQGITTSGIEPFDRWMNFTVVMTVRDTLRRDPKNQQLRSILAHHTRGTDCGYNGWDWAIEDGYLDVRLGRVWPGNAISVRSKTRIPADRWCQIATSYDGSSTARGIRFFVDGIELETVVIRDELKKQANVKVDHGGEFVIGQRFRDRGFAGGLVDDVRLYKRDLTPSELVALATGSATKIDFDTYAKAFDPSVRSARTELLEARKAFVLAEEAAIEIPIMRENGVRETHLLARGQYDAPKSDETRVSRSVPDSLGIPLPTSPAESYPRNGSETPDRLSLARWVTDPKHPLTSRVAMNRLWGNFFESPLVRTPENFGLQGELPTHPALLDWLSREFIRSGWNTKSMCKLIVLSATYRQDSKSSPQSLETDPENRLLARGPAHRLSAEQIRDLALASSGLLDTRVGGPPVSPYQPGDDLWREANGMSPAFQQSVGKDLHRRSIYSVWKRTVPLPNMMALDATTREVCTVRRSRTNTPLQALVLMNDIQFVEAARAMADNVLSQNHSAASDFIPVAFQRCTGRSPDSFELKTLLDLHQQELEYFHEHVSEAEEFVGIGEAGSTTQASTEELAAATAVCQAILNLDAAIWKR
ncbi:MAG: alpha/beta fold hydrolase [Aureliella sp.]